MKAVILAAGVGTRLRPITLGCPKCLVELHGRPVILHQIDALHACGITDIDIIVGFEADQIKAAVGDLASYHYFPDFARTNNLYTLNHCSDVLDDDVVIMFADVLMSAETLRRVIDSTSDFALLSDTSRVLENTMRILLDDNDTIKDIGGHIPASEGDGNFVGIARYSKAAAAELRAEMRRLVEAGGHQGAYYIQAVKQLADEGRPITPVRLDGDRWLEIDTLDELNQARNASFYVHGDLTSLTPGSGAQRLRRLFKGDGLIRLAAAHNPLGAKLVEEAGFEGVWSSSLEISASQALPDANILGMEDYLRVAEGVADAVTIPVVADVDTGYGNSNNVIHMVRKFEKAGIAAVCMEDKLFPKVNSFVPGRQELATVPEFVGKLMAAVSARKDPDFMIFARVEALIAGHGMEEALRRSKIYAEAGADGILIHSKQKQPDEIFEFARRWDLDTPLIVVPTTYNTVTADELRDLGIRMVIYANHGIRTAITAMRKTFSQILKDGTTAHLESDITPMSEVFELQGMPRFKEDEKRFVRTGEPTRAVILAAGNHTRVAAMRALTEDQPFAMLDLANKPLLQRQAEAFNQAGVSDVSVVTGYRSDQVQVDGVRAVKNDAWEDTGNAYSFAAVCSANPFNGRTVVAFGDVLFNDQVVSNLISSAHDITLVVDQTRPDPGAERLKKLDKVSLTAPPAQGRRSLETGNANKVLAISKNLPDENNHCEFIGLAMFSESALQTFVDTFDDLHKSGPEAPLGDSPSVRLSSIVDVIGHMISEGTSVNIVEVSKGWSEIHSMEDYKMAYEALSGGNQSNDG